MGHHCNNMAWSALDTIYIDRILGNILTKMIIILHWASICLGTISNIPWQSVLAQLHKQDYIVMEAYWDICKNWPGPKSQVCNFHNCFII